MVVHVLFVISADHCHTIQVQEAVHGVTTEECQAALQNHNWNVQKAVHYLKVSYLRVAF